MGVRLKEPDPVWDALNKNGYTLLVAITSLEMVCPNSPPNFSHL